jgi:hypothetical protein
VPRSMHKKQRNASTAPSAEDLAAIKMAFNALYNGLVEAKQLFEAGRNDGRDGAIHAVESIPKFLQKSAPIRSLGFHAPLIALFDALMSLDDGEVRPILKKRFRRTGGRGRASGMRESIKGAVVFTVHALHATELPLPAAHKLVASALQKQGVTAERGRDGGVTARTVRGWCADVAADVGRRGEAARTFELLKGCSLQTDADPKNIRRKLLDDLVGLIRQLIPTITKAS